MAEGFGARLEAARVAAGLNKNQLARAIGTSWQHVDHWERDRTAPNAGSVQRLASVLGVSVGYLLGHEPPAAAMPEALRSFLESYAPADLTPAEVAWLRSAPIDPRLATPGTYLDLVHRIRGGRPAETAPAPRPAPGSGPRRKIDREDAMPVVPAKKA